MRRFSLIAAALVATLALAWLAKPLWLPAFRNSSPENRLLVEVLRCRFAACTHLDVDFHDYSGLTGVPGFVRIAKQVRTARFHVFELQQVSALARLPNLEEVDLRGSARVSAADIDFLKARGIIVRP
ncbi:hypothetical protein FHY55_10935 [Oceanicola sp. D3]|uniref:hypothetical protein n=1 Tax=Oceanicola sp. D3 TaxID=2587163 RepID=UPI001120DF67|nr:hypothetical protein [Oceanicola sp. D3]QDC09729.1 hypothetical protein FHY55_10935 [Oceanicola sp. D3]